MTYEQALDAKESKYFSDGQEYVFESASYYARSRQLARAEQAIVKARRRLEGDCKQRLDKRTMPDWEVVNQLAVESLSYITQYLKIETYGKSTTKDDLKAMAEINFRPPAAQPAPVQEPVGRTDQQIVDQTEELAVWLLSWCFNHQPETDAPMRESAHPFAERCWAAACHIQEMLTATDPENAVAELDVDDTPPAAQRQFVGLTDEEITELEETTTCLANESWLRNLTHAIEAKLKEKNNG
jgi:hypothetical protein